ncbi:MAG: DUF58 domain-containing protein [Verrucomicrobia bacterium]|nr:DUF58 domain-containing protein [Verrucomicrobiota bacterium]
MAIRNLELRARAVVEGFWTGLHRSPFHGFSVEFTEYRPYALGEDPRYLDWRRFARTDRYYLKKFEEETNLRCYLLVDQSRSMSYGTFSYSKAAYAGTLAATLAQFLYLQGDAVGLLTFGDRIREYVPARHRRGHLRQLMHKLEQPSADTATNLAAPLQRILELVRRRSLVVLLSDLLAPVQALERHLTALTACGHEAVLFQVLDPAELEFGFGQPAMFEDVESGRELYLDPVTARKGYQQRFAAHCAGVVAVCQNLGIGHRQLPTHRPLELALFDFLRERQHRGRLIRRAGSRRPRG